MFGRYWVVTGCCEQHLLPPCRHRLVVDWSFTKRNSRVCYRHRSGLLLCVFYNSAGFLPYSKCEVHLQETAAAAGKGPKVNRSQKVSSRLQMPPSTTLGVFDVTQVLRTPVRAADMRQLASLYGRNPGQAQ